MKSKDIILNQDSQRGADVAANKLGFVLAAFSAPDEGQWSQVIYGTI
jgi:hypothetical protein